MVSNCSYDYLAGSNGTCTPFRYDLNYRNYYLVTEGTVKIKLAPPRSDKYLYTYKDYENFEFRSPVNAWNVQQQYRPDFDKIKCLEVVVKKGQIIFIPAFWWNTMRFEDDASVCAFKYKTYMNTVAMFPQLFMRFLQSHNVKRNIVSNKAQAGVATANANAVSVSDINVVSNTVSHTNTSSSNAVSHTNTSPNAVTDIDKKEETSSIDSLPIA